MAAEAVSYHEDVERLRQQFVEFRQAHAVRSRLPEELWTAAVKLARRDGITATARALGLDRPSLQKWTDRLEPRASRKPHENPARAPVWRKCSARFCGTIGRPHRDGNQLFGRTRINQRQHPTLHSGDACPAAKRAKCMRREW